MTRIKDIQQVNEDNLFSAREKCYEAFNENIDGGDSVENSCKIIKTQPRKRIHRYWRNAYIALYEGNIIAGMSSCPYDIHFHSTSLSMIGIGDVFSIKKGTNSIEALISKIFDEHTTVGLSVLYPFSDYYYSQYGYAPVFYQDEIHISKKYINKYSNISSSKLRKATKEDIHFLTCFYEEKAKNFTGTAIRNDELDWMYSDYALSEEGYIAYGVNSGKIIIRESVGLSFEEIVSFCISQYPNIEKIILKNTFGQDLFEPLSEHNIEVTTFRKLHGMARIVNIDSCLKSIHHKTKGRIKIKVHDNIINSNNRIIQYTWDDDFINIEESTKYDLELDIRDLTKLVCNGYRGQIKVSKDLEQTIKDAFPCVDSACYEIF